MSLQELISGVIAPIIIVLVIYLYFFYSKLKQYPNGPIPVPIFGNTLMLVGNLKRNPSYFFKELAKNYEGIYTFWFGSKPVVFITSINLGKKAFNKNECCDRWENNIETQICDTFFDGCSNIIFMNRTEEFKNLRSISVYGVRKFLASNKLSDTTNRIVDDIANKIIKHESGKEFGPNVYIESMFIRILSETIFGEILEWNDPRIEQIEESFETIQANTLKVFLGEMIPVLKLVFNPLKHCSIGNRTISMFRNWFDKRLGLNNQSLDNYECFTDLSILLNNENNEFDCLNHQQLFGNLNGMFFASTDTVSNTFKWIILLMAYYPELQETMRSEIQDKQGDKENCHFVNAFINETLRFRNIAPFGVYHTALKDTHIDDIKIPGGTMMALHLDSILNDQNYWKEPEAFRPERFLDSNHELNPTNPTAFIPFSTGKRKCIGDKFAENILFLILTRLLQATNGYQFVLGDKQNTDLEPKIFAFFNEPKPYSIRIIKK